MSYSPIYPHENWCPACGYVGHSNWVLLDEVNKCDLLYVLSSLNSKGLAGGTRLRTKSDPKVDRYSWYFCEKCATEKGYLW